TCIYGMLILPYHFHCTSVPHFQLLLSSQSPTNPHTIVHLIFPQGIWPVSDPIIFGTMGIVLIVLCLLWQIKKIPIKYEFNAKNHLLSYEGRGRLCFINFFKNIKKYKFFLVLDRRLSGQMFTITV